MDVKQHLQFDLLNRFRTGNAIFDAILQSLLFAAVTALFANLSIFGNFFNEKINKFTCMMWWIYEYIKYDLLKFNKNEKISKTIQIEHITETKQINELFKAVNWFLANNSLIDYLKESPLKFTYEKKPELITDTETININKHVIQNTWKKLKYENHEISYMTESKIITVYADKKKEKENLIISLNVTVSSNFKRDILADFCQHCLQEYSKSLKSSVWKQLIYTNINNQWKSEPSNNKRKFKTISLKNGLKDELINDINMFLESEEFYDERDVPYTRGYLFYGAPGCGKTSCIKAISNLTKRHIHYLMLNNVKNDESLLKLLSEIDYQSTIVVIEDIDCMTNIIKDRKMEENTELLERLEKLEKTVNDPSVISNPKHHITTIDEKSTLTLSGLLNAIDGVFNSHGRILIMTTNHPEKLDDALIRPGRIDRRYEFENCDQKQISELYFSFFGETCNPEILKNIKYMEYSPAYITSLFMYYRNNPKKAMLNLDNFGVKFKYQPELKNKIIKLSELNKNNSNRY